MVAECVARHRFNALQVGMPEIVEPAAGIAFTILYQPEGEIKTECVRVTSLVQRSSIFLVQRISPNLSLPLFSALALPTLLVYLYLAQVLRNVRRAAPSPTPRLRRKQKRAA